MSLLIQLAMRNVQRNARRSMLTALMITAGAVLLILGMSWIDGVFNGAMNKGALFAGHVRVVKPGFAQKEQFFPLEENVADSAPVVTALLATPGVEAAYPRIQMGVTVTASEEIGENFGLLVGAPTELYQKYLSLEASLTEGHLPAADDEVVIGLTIADQIGAKLGQEIVVLGQTQDGSMSPAKLKVVGLYDLGSVNQNKMLYVTLEEVRYLADIPGGATEIVAYTADRLAALDVAHTAAADPAMKGLEVKAWMERSPYDALLGVVGTVQAIAGTVIVLITALGVLNTMLMSVLERTGEIGVMRAMGLKLGPTLVMVVIEAVVIAVVGGGLGVAGGGLLAWAWLERHGINLGAAVKGLPSAIPINSIVYGDVKPSQLVTAFVLGLVMALVGALIPAIRAAGIQPVEAMRSRR